MFTPATPYTKIAFDTIKHHLLEGSKTPFVYPEIPNDLYRIRRGCFVSLHTWEEALRGCIGTIEPNEKSLVEEIRINALGAAFRDHRFSPLSADELENITLSVDVLTTPEPISAMEDLDPKIFGLIISDGQTKRGVLLPSVPGIDTSEKQIRVVKQKAGLSHIDNDRLFYYRFTSNRYH